MKETPMGAQPVRNNFGEEKRKRGREAKLLSSFCTAQLSSQLSPLTSTLLTCMGKSCFLPNFEGTQGTWRISLRTISNSKTLYVFHFQPMLRKEELWQSQWNSFRSCCLWPVRLRDFPHIFLFGTIWDIDIAGDDEIFMYIYYMLGSSNIWQPSGENELLYLMSRFFFTTSPLSLFFD